MFANNLRRITSNLIQKSNNALIQSLRSGRSAQLLTPTNVRFFATNVRDDKQTTKGAGLETPTQGASKNAGIGTQQGGNHWRDAVRDDAVGGVKSPAKEWASEIKDKIREPAGNTAPAEAGTSNEWAAPGSAKDTLKNNDKAGQKGNLDAEERHYVGTAGTEIPKGKKTNAAQGGSEQKPKDSVHETDQTGRGTTYVGIKGGKPDNTGGPAGNDVSGGTSSQYPGDPSRGGSRQGAGTAKSNVHANDSSQSKSGNVQDRNVNNTVKGK